MKLLLIDDDVEFREYLRECLEAKGHEVMAPGDIDAARSLLAGAESYDAVVCDIRMPRVTGIELLHFAKRKKPCRFILMSGYPDIVQKSEAYTLGADEFLPKPFKIEALLQRLQNLRKAA